MKKSETYYQLRRAEKAVLDKLKNDYRTKRHTKPEYSYEVTIRKELFVFYDRDNINIRYFVTKLDDYSANVLMYIADDKYEFNFDGRQWIREQKLKKLL